MTQFVLILFFYTYRGTTMEHVPGFIDRAECMAAGQLATAAAKETLFFPSDGNIRFTCVPQTQQKKG